MMTSTNMAALERLVESVSREKLDGRSCNEVCSKGSLDGMVNNTPPALRQYRFKGSSGPWPRMHRRTFWVD